MLQGLWVMAESRIDAKQMKVIEGAPGGVEAAAGRVSSAPQKTSSRIPTGAPLSGSALEAQSSARKGVGSSYGSWVLPPPRPAGRPTRAAEAREQAVWLQNILGILLALGVQHHREHEQPGHSDPRQW